MTERATAEPRRRRRDQYGMVACPPGAVLHVTCDDCGATKDIPLARATFSTAEIWMNSDAEGFRLYDSAHQCGGATERMGDD